MKSIVKIVLAVGVVTSFSFSCACDRGIDATSEIDSMVQPSCQQHNNTTQAILGSLVGMLSNFAAIVANPHNGNVVGANITSMLAGLINIAMQGSKRAIVDPSVLYELIKLDDATRAEFEKCVVELALQIQQRGA